MITKEKRWFDLFLRPINSWEKGKMVSTFVCSALVEVAEGGSYTPQSKSPAGLTPSIISPSEDPSEEIPGSVRIQDWSPTGMFHLPSNRSETRSL